MGNPWTDLVKQTFRTGKKSNAMYSLKDAMVAAKKVYKKMPDANNVTGKKKVFSKKKRRTARRKGSRRR